MKLNLEDINKAFESKARLGIMSAIPAIPPILH